MLPTRKWWHTATLYELYPSSFKDSNSDGIGDVPGIISKIPYLAKLGIDAVWLAACYKSSGVDMGYDVVDYRDIDPQYGTVADLDTLIAELDKHNIRLIMDLVVNHTSDQHAWFQESRSSRTSPKRNWYVWRKGRLIEGKRHPPNNWESIFTGSAWEYDEVTEEYYLRIFAKEQPDLNWEHDELRQAVYDDMRFWLDKGVSGFRMDVINLISKATNYPDAPVVDPNKSEQWGGALYSNGPRVHEYLQEMRREVLDQYPEAMTVGEVIITDSPKVVQEFVRPERKELNMIYQYDLFGIDHGRQGKYFARAWSVCEFKFLVAKWQDALSYSSGGWATIWLESHDSGRSVTRFGDRAEQNRFKVAKMLALLQSTLGGTLFLYQGQEIGMKCLTADIPIEDYPDLETQRVWQDIIHQRKMMVPSGTDIDMADVAEQVRIKARDHARMPLPWTSADEASHAGFSDSQGKTWSPMNTDSDTCNIAQQEIDPHSVLNFWGQCIALRKSNAEALVFGDFEVVNGSTDNGSTFAYWRKPLLSQTHEVHDTKKDDNRNVLVVLNLTNENCVPFQMPGAIGLEVTQRKYLALKGTHPENLQSLAFVPGQQLTLSAYEGVAFSC